MYLELAISDRRCTAVATSTGRRCKAWAVWRANVQRCSAHLRLQAGSRRRRGQPSPRPPSRPLPCRCAAYKWSHRPSGGLCRWPNVPDRVWQTPLGTRSDIAKDLRAIARVQRRIALRMARR